MKFKKSKPKIKSFVAAYFKRVANLTVCCNSPKELREMVDKEAEYMTKDFLELLEAIHQEWENTIFNKLRPKS